MRVSDRAIVSHARSDSAEVGEQPVHLGRRVPVAAGARALRSPSKTPSCPIDLLRLEVRLAELLVGGDLILGMIGDQRERRVAGPPRRPPRAGTGEASP